MKLVNEYSIKVIIMIICFILALECCILFFIYKDSNNIFDHTYKETLKRTEEKTLEITRNIKMFTANYIMKFITEIKLIARYSVLFNGKNMTKEENTINKNSKYVKNNKKQKKIIKADLTQIFMSSEFRKIFKALGQLNEYDLPNNPSSLNLNYIKYYSQLFVNETNDNKLINKLFKQHNELNYISHHYYGNNSAYDISQDKEKEEIIKNILSIMKTIYIKRLISKKSDMDIIRFFVLTEEDLFIYPPEDYRKINLIKFRTVYTNNPCKYTEADLSDYPSCVYAHMFNHLFPDRKNYLLILRESIEYLTIYGAYCLKFPFYKDRPDKSAICLELDLTYSANKMSFSDSNVFEFGLFNLINVPQMNFRDILVIFDSLGNAHSELFDTYNSTETTPPLYVLNASDSTKLLKYFSLYHFMYFDLTNMIKEIPELDIDLKKIEEEYKFVRDKLFEIEQEYKQNDKQGDKKEIYPFNFNRTTCRKQLLANEYECITDESKMVIMPLFINITKINEDFLEIDEIGGEHHDLFIYTIISTNPKTNKEKINAILRIKIIRIICLFLSINLIIICVFIFFINLFSEYSFNEVEQIINDINEIELNNENGKIELIKENKNFMANNEMLNLKYIYETMRKSLIIKNVFNKNNFLKEHHLEFYQIVQDMKIRNIKEICNSFLAYFHFSNKIYNISENEFKSTINFVKDDEKKLKIGGKNEIDDKLKDAIKRSSTVSYLNEYSNFDNIDENMKDNIYIKIFKQRFIYLYAMTKYKLGSEINYNNDNKNKNKKIKEQKENYLKEAIKYFQECYKINTLLGINQIKIIYSLIMISNCYEKLNDYKNAILNINEALSLYFNFSKNFTEYHSKHYNPRIMLFIENNIFHYILFTYSKICLTFNKPSASNWIILRIFETSPFYLNNVHFHAGMNLLNFFDKNKKKMNKYEQNFYKNVFIMKEFDKIKKRYGKIIARLYIKNYNDNNNNNDNSSKKLICSNYTNNNNKISTIDESVTDKVSSNLKKEMVTSRISSLFHNKNKKTNKTITLCLSEAILEKIKGQVLKEVLIKYFQKYFEQNESDKFSFVQFASNGKKNVFIKLENLNKFLLKLQKAKGSFEFTDSFKSNKDFVFTDLYNILDSIIKTYSNSEETDNIIMVFIDSKDIRFSSEDDCLNIVEDLNKKNVSLYFFSFEKEMKPKKVNNIQSFLSGLIEGYFFHIKNYQQLKPILINNSSFKKQTNFFGFDYNIFEYVL